MLLISSLQRKYQDGKGRSPKWLRQLSNALFASVWKSYDELFKLILGDGERTMYDRDEDAWGPEDKPLLHDGWRDEEAG